MLSVLNTTLNKAYSILFYSILFYSILFRYFDILRIAFNCLDVRLHMLYVLRKRQFIINENTQ